VNNEDTGQSRVAWRRTSHGTLDRLARIVGERRRARCPDSLSDAGAPPLAEERLTYIAFVCRCGQREEVRIGATGYTVCCEGPFPRAVKRHPCPYRYDPRCSACGRYRHPVIKAFSGTVPGPTSPERALES
jgi:hypothetical protein